MPLYEAIRYDAEHAMRPQIIASPPGFPRQTWVVGIDGKIEKLDHQDPISNEVAGDLASFVALIKCQDDAIVYVGYDKVVALLDRVDRRSTVTLPLQKSKRFEMVLKHGAQVAYTPRDAQRLLKFGLTNDGSLNRIADALQKIDFATGTSGQTTAQRGKDTMQRSVNAADDCPENFSIDVLALDTGGFTGVTVPSMRFDLDLNPSDPQRPILFQLFVGEVERAEWVVKNQVRELIEQAIVDEVGTSKRDESVTVVIGCPGPETIHISMPSLRGGVGGIGGPG